MGIGSKGFGVSSKIPLGAERIDALRQTDQSNRGSVLIVHAVAQLARHPRWIPFLVNAADVFMTPGPIAPLR
jgi:hypothetical protein